jgi:phage terminase Nu1 subunit (DNA packaging protein)
MTRKPRKKLLDRQELAEAMGVIPGTITRWERDGMPVAKRAPRGKPSKFDLAAVREWREAVDAEAEAQTLSLSEERAKLAKRQREKLELEMRVRRGELVELATVSKEFADIATAVRTRLRAISTTVAPQLAGLDAKAAEALLRTRIDDALRELARGETPAEKTA